MKTCLWRRGVTAFLFLSMAAAVAVANDPSRPQINCDIQQGPCSQRLAESKVTLEILPKPVRAMQDLTFKVTVDSPLHISKPPYIDLNMPAMDMGPNRVLLERVGNGVFEGRGVIVRCRSGDKTWQAKLILPDAGSATFIFDVVY